MPPWLRSHLICGLLFVYLFLYYSNLKISALCGVFRSFTSNMIIGLVRFKSIILLLVFHLPQVFPVPLLLSLERMLPFLMIPLFLLLTYWWWFCFVILVVTLGFKVYILSITTYLEVGLCCFTYCIKNLQYYTPVYSLLLPLCYCCNKFYLHVIKSTVPYDFCLHSHLFFKEI